MTTKKSPTTKEKPTLLGKAPAASIGSLIDRLYEMRADRIKMSNQVDKIKGDEQAMRFHIIDLLEASKLEGAKGRIANASISRSEAPNLEDWGKFTAFVFRTKDSSLLWRRVNEGAIKERWAAKKQVPGIGVREVKDLSLSKV